MQRRVVITGLGSVTSLGNDIAEFWKNVKAGVCGIDEITKFDTTDFRCKLASEVKNVDFEKYIDAKEIKRLDDNVKYALIAADEAVKDSKLNLDKVNHDRLGVFVGSGIGGLTTIQNETIKLEKSGPKRVSPLFIPMAIGNMAAGNVAIRFNAQGPCHSIVTACATSTHSIGEAFNYIRFDLADVIIAGGAEASINRLGIAGFDALKALSPETDKNRASIPFDAERNGFIMGEGAGILVLEEYEHAKARGAKIYAEIVSYASTCDAYHVTTPSGEGAAKAMDLAIKNAGIKPDDVDYINAHGTSTKYNDKFETLGIKKVFGEDTKVMVSSTKSMTGHLLGAAGAVEAIICVKGLEEGFVPATINYKVEDEECKLDVVPNQGRNIYIKYAMSNSLGFGGHNGTLIFKKMED